MGNKKMTVKKLFNFEVKAELEKSRDKKTDVFTTEEISVLPEPVRRYFKYCNYIGHEKMNAVKFVFDNVRFKMGVDKQWIKIKYSQFNFVSEPARIAYIYSKMFGLIPFEGRDKYMDGQGNMLGRLLKKITIFDVRGDEMNISAASTFLAEALAVPSCALQEYIRWEAIDSNHAKATIEYKGLKAQGTFTFGEDGELIKFQTDDRYMYANGKSEKHTWSAVMSDYIEKNGVKIPSRVKGVWNLPDGDYEYFDGELLDIESM